VDAHRQAEISEQTRFLLEVRDRISSAHATVAQIRSIVSLIENTHSDGFRQGWESLRAELQHAETQLVSRDVIGPADYHRYPSGLNARLMGLAFRVGESDGPVTSSHRKVLTELSERQSGIMARLGELASTVQDLRQMLPEPGHSENPQFPTDGFEFESIWAR
jgi:hypothetical protein